MGLGKVPPRGEAMADVVPFHLTSDPQVPYIWHP